MERKRSTFTSSTSKNNVQDKSSREKSRKARGDCPSSSSTSTSHTQYYKQDRYSEKYERVTRTEFSDVDSSLTTTESYHCVHPEGKEYTDKQLLRRNLVRKLDPIKPDTKVLETCKPVGWEMASVLRFLVEDPVGSQQFDRISQSVSDLCKTAEDGYNLSILDSLCLVMDYLVENLHKHPDFKHCLDVMIDLTHKPIKMNHAQDNITEFSQLQNFMAFLGYLMLRLEDEGQFAAVARGLVWQLSAGRAARGPGAVSRRHALLAAAGPALHQVVARMIAVARPNRFLPFLKLALILAMDSEYNCVELVKENILDNLLHRFNPYFPDSDLPVTYESNPTDAQDFNLKLGDSSKHLETTLSVLLVLLKTLKNIKDKDLLAIEAMPCPEYHSQRCFAWAYRLVCRSAVHKPQRITMTAVAVVMLHTFGSRLRSFAVDIMPGVMAMSIQSEVPLLSTLPWTRKVSITKSQLDVQFKTYLIYFSALLLKTFPTNIFMVEWQLWLMGLMYLLDPELSRLQAPYSASQQTELRVAALQALVLTLHMMPYKLVKDYNLIRRIMWYVEWYTESPFPAALLYWCVRLLMAAVRSRRPEPIERAECASDLFDTHGVIVLMHLCYSLLTDKSNTSKLSLPVEKCQVVLAGVVRLLTTAVELDRRLTCCVYPYLKWPRSVNRLVDAMLQVVLDALDHNRVVSERWLISLLNLVWQAVVWRKDHRDTFVAKNGIYKLLDIIVVSPPAVQCLGLAVVCDVARAGDAVGQIVTWRRNVKGPFQRQESSMNIAGLLAKIFREECQVNGILLQENGVVVNVRDPLMSIEMREHMAHDDLRGSHGKTLECFAAADLAGSRMSKAFALLHMLNADLQHKVSLLDHAYKLYKHITLSEEDEVALVLCSHFLTLKHCEAWTEVERMCQRLVPQDADTLNEFTDISYGWVVEIIRQQKAVITKHINQANEEEKSLYAFLARVRLNIALEALREVRCVARSGDRGLLERSLLHNAVDAYNRRATAAAAAAAGDVIKTYRPPLHHQLPSVRVEDKDPDEIQRNRDAEKIATWRQGLYHWNLMGLWGDD